MVSSSILAEMQWVGKTHSTAGGRRFEAAGSSPSSCGRLWEDQSVRKRSLDFERERGNKCPVTGWHLWKEARDGGCLVLLPLQFQLQVLQGLWLPSSPAAMGDAPVLFPPGAQTRTRTRGYSPDSGRGLGVGVGDQFW